MDLSLERPAFYRVKRGQTICSVAKTYHIPPRLLAAENSLTEELSEGQVLRIPPAEGHLYVVRGGESKTLLCGSPENFRKKNGTDCFYIGQTILL